MDGDEAPVTRKRLFPLMMADSDGKPASLNECLHARHTSGISIFDLGEIRGHIPANSGYYVIAKKTTVLGELPTISTNKNLLISKDSSKENQ